MPSSTLTQRRGKSLTSAKKEANKETEIKSPRTNLTSIDQMTQSAEDGGSVLKIIIWGVIILATGVGLALVVRNLTNKNTQEADSTTEEETVVEEEDTTEEIEEIEEITDDTDEVIGEEEDTTNTETTEEETTTTLTGDGLTNEYSKTDQTLGEGLTGNTVTIGGYSYATTSTNFVYTIKLSNATPFPTVNASLDETAKTLTIIVDNILRDNIVGNGGTGSTTFSTPRNAQSVAISNSGNKTTFVFTLTKATEYKIYAGEGDTKTILVEIKNN